MKLSKLLSSMFLLTLLVGTVPAEAGSIAFTGEAIISVSVSSDQPYSLLGYYYNVAEVGNYLNYPHENKVVGAYRESDGSASIAAPGMLAKNNYSLGKFSTEGKLQAEVSGFTSQYNENRMDIYIDVAGGIYDFTISVDSWKRTYGWDQTGGGSSLTEAGWYSNMFAKLVREGTIFREANLVLLSEVKTVFSPALDDISETGGSNTSLSFSDVELAAGIYTIYLADYMTQYGVDPPSVPVPGTLLLLGSGLMALVSLKLKTLV